MDSIIYITNDDKRVASVPISELKQSRPPTDRNGYQQTVKCNKAKDGVTGQDQGGHLVAARFGGPGEQINLVPMRKTLNQHPGDWAEMEQEWQNVLMANGTVTDIHISIAYGTDGRPLHFVVTAKINGQAEDYLHVN